MKFFDTYCYFCGSKDSVGMEGWFIWYFPRESLVNPTSSVLACPNCCETDSEMKRMCCDMVGKLGELVFALKVRRKCWKFIRKNLAQKVSVTMKRPALRPYKGSW